MLLSLSGQKGRYHYHVWLYYHYHVFFCFFSTFPLCLFSHSCSQLEYVPQIPRVSIWYKAICTMHYAVHCNALVDCRQWHCWRIGCHSELLPHYLIVIKPTATTATQYHKEELGLRVFEGGHWGVSEKHVFAFTLYIFNWPSLSPGMREPSENLQCISGENGSG